MSVLEATVLITRWAHIIATVAWIGGNIFYLAILRPAIRNHPPDSADVVRFIGERFKQTVDLAMWVLLITGALLIYDRLTQEIGQPYAIILAIKLILSSAMFVIAISLGRRGARRRASPVDGLWSEILPRPLAQLAADASVSWSRVTSPTTILFVLGPVVILLGLLLRFVAGE